MIYCHLYLESIKLNKDEMHSLYATPVGSAQKVEKFVYIYRFGALRSGGINSTKVEYEKTV